MILNFKYWGLFCGILTALLWVLSIPPFDFPEAAYVAFVPLFLWLYTKPAQQSVWIVGLATGWLSWFVILIWLRHVTWFGTIALSGVLALFFASWLYLGSSLLHHIEKRNILLRALCFAGLAGAWVVLEWSRTWFLWGFPWAPLSLSQWQRPVVLQIAAWTGAYGVSFLIVFFNLCLAQTLRQRFVQKKGALWMGFFSSDLYLGLSALFFCIYVFFYSLPARDSTDEILTAAVVQPYILPDLKWEIDRNLENLEALERQTLFVSTLESDIILWPESATPWPIIGSQQICRRLERLVNEINKPILMGNISEDTKTGEWSNGTFLVEPESGLSEQFYTKRELVPFGEYVPCPFGFIRKVVPLNGSFVPGDNVGLIDLELGISSTRVGSLVCYEDAFPALARESASKGAKLFFVVTNNAWYGEEGAAEQHAAHSVLRAVENRRPVMRAGNGGWSGWIDSYGTVRDVLVDSDGSIYFRGGGAFTIFQYKEWARQQSYYTRHGDWFVSASAVLALAALVLLRKPN